MKSDREVEVQVLAFSA